MKHSLLTLLAGLGLLAAGCAKDNSSPPGSQLTGRITYQNQSLNVRGQGGVQLGCGNAARKTSTRFRCS